eukprot:XP_011681010.1 PREDICTED: uncharacterized protein LOC579093 [Strongylocentrotus purpuratus]
MSFFRSGDPRELFERIWTILGPADEGASASAQGQGNRGVEMDWILIDRKKKKSRPDGKDRPSHASGSVPQLRSSEGGNVTRQGQRSPGHPPSSGRSSGGSFTVRSQRAGSAGQPAPGPRVLGTYQGTASAEKWVVDYKLRLACRKCFTNEAPKHGYNSYRLNVNPTHFPKCRRDYLLCLLARTPKNGHQAVYGIIRCRPDDAKHSLCDHFQNGDPCKELSCCSCHSREEQDIWLAEKEGRFPRDDVIALLRTQGQHDQGKSNRNCSTPARSRSESLVSQDNSDFKSRSNSAARPRRESRVSLDNGDAKRRSNSVATSRSGSPYWQTGMNVVPREVATASSVCNSPGLLCAKSNNRQRFQKMPGHSVVRLDKALLDELKRIGGKFLVVCMQCFESKPVKISPPNPNNRTVCLYKNHSMTMMPNRCLVHQFGVGRFTKIRKRPFRVMHKPIAVCRYVDRIYGCEREDSCHFAHSETEAKVWWLEARLGKQRKEIIEACIDLNHPATSRPSPAGSRLSVPHALINPHQGTWGSSNRSLKQPPSAACAIPVESCHSKVPFGHSIKRACGRCLCENPYRIQTQSPNSPSYCSGASRHSWGANILYVVHSSKDKQWVRVNPRHPRLWSRTKLHLCWNGKQCKQESVFGTACMHPHTQEELVLWEYQKLHNLSKLEEVVRLQQQAQAASNPLPKPEQTDLTQHTCSFCKFSSTSKTDFENHLLTTAHKAMIFSDSDRLWKERDPPNLVQDGSYAMCKENATKQCEHSGMSKEENECIYAHSLEELREWKQRHQHRLMKLGKAREMKLYSWLDNLVEEKTSAEDMEDVKEYRPQTCPGGLLRRGDSDEYSLAVNFIQSHSGVFKQWLVLDFGDRPCLALKLSVTIGLKSEMKELEFKEQTVNTADLWNESNSKIIKCTQQDEWTHRLEGQYPTPGSHRVPALLDPGDVQSLNQNTYRQFMHDMLTDEERACDRPCLALKLSVTIGFKSEMKELEFKEQTVNTADLWNESNSEIIKCTQQDEWTHRLEGQYPTPGSHRVPALLDPGDVQSLNQNTYRQFMHDMLTDEERACMEMVAKYRTVTIMKVSDHVELEHSLLGAEEGELFGTITLDKPLHDDSEASRLVQEFVETIFIKFHEQSDVVYEALKKQAEKGAVVITLGSSCVKERQLKGGMNVSVTIQLCISRERFLSMHHAVDTLSCMDTVLPKGQQPNRFPEVAAKDCLEGLNSRQEQVVRLIKSLETRGKEATTYSGPTMILGPFGTGKTHTLAKAIQRTLTERKDAKFLICTHSNSAADLYIRDYLHKFCEENPDTWMVRVYATMRNLSTVRDPVKQYMLLDAAGPRLPTEEECQDWVCRKGPSIVVITLNTAVHLTKTATLRGYFSHIVIDEAGQALETEAIIPLALATEDTSVVLAGDPKQMSPQVHSPRTRKAKFNMSLLQRLFKYDKQNDCHASCNLTINYRSCQPILDFLKVHYGTAFISKSTSSGHPNLFPLNFVDVRGEDQLVGTSYMNAEEAKIIAEYVASLMKHWPEEWDRPKKSDVVVLSPYRVQVKVIRQELRKRGLHAVTVETVQNVQGKQYRAVFLSTVRTRSSLNKVDITSLPQVGDRNVRNKFWYGFLSDKALLNTAFTRAQSLITVMGDPVAVCSAGECQKTWQRYIKTCERNGAIHSKQGLTMASIQNEIANAKRLLNPTAKSFIPRASASSTASRGIPHTVTARPGVSRAIEVPSCSPRTGKQQRSAREYPPATSSRLPAPDAGAAASAVDDDDEEDDDLLGDEWLQELKIQVDEDMAEEYRRSHPEVLAEDQEAASRQESDGGDTSIEREQSKSAIPIQEPEAGVRLQTAQRHKTTPSASRATVPNAASRTNEHVFRNLRMVEREDRYALLQDDTYDSDDEDGVNVDTSGQAQDTNVEELLRKALQRPDMYKICIFRQNITGRTYAVPQDRQSGDEISITNMKRRGHALNGDKVLVEVLENEEEQEVEEDDDAERERKIYGRVVGIIEHNANLRFQKFVCYLDPRSDNVMVPIDRSSPKMLILGRKKRSASKKNAAVVTLFEIKKKRVQTQNACSSRRDVEVKHAERHQKLFVVRYLEWAHMAPYPLGAAVEELEPGNTEQKGLTILRLVYGIKAQCKSGARKQMQQDFPEGWSLPDEAVQKREDFRTTKTIFTVDPPGSTDLDDAISCVCLPGQRYEVGIHIADVSYFIHQDSFMDKDAYKRGTTFYHPFQGDAYHMLPKDVISRLLSLLPGQDRLALSVIFILDHEGHVVAEPMFRRSVIQSCKRLTYEEAEKLIVDSNNTSNAYVRVAKPIRYLYELSRHRRMQRLKDGWMVYNADDDDGGALSHPRAHSLIEELMLMTNNAVAEHVLTWFPECTPLRRQLAPSQEKVETWKECHEKTARNSIRLPELVNRNHNDAARGDQEVGQDGEHVLVAAEVWQKVRESCESQNASRSHMEDMANLILQDENHPRHAVAQSHCYDIMESAEYIDSTSQTKPEKREHYSLQMRAYTHFTSPIRRYIDLVVHRMLVACIENSQCPYTAGEMADITHHCDKQNAKSKRFSKATKELKLALKLKEAPLQVTTFVEGIFESSMKLLLPYRGYIQSSQRQIPFSFLKPSEKPVVNEASPDVQVTWKCRMYDYSRKCQTESPASTRFTYPDIYFRIPEDKWQQILQSIKSMYRDGNLEEVRTAIETALIHAQGNDNPFSQRRGNQDGRPDQSKMGIMSFQRSYQLGDPCRVQMHAQMMKGMLTPKVQLFNMTPNLDICAEHRSQPIECFSRIATESPGREKNMKAYKSKWLQILSMVSSHSAVINDDTITLQNVPITWQRTSSEVTGHFQLDKNFLEVNHIQIGEGRDGMIMNNYDYLCIHLANLDVETKPQLKIKGYDKRERGHRVGPFNAKDWEKQTSVLHCRILKGENSQDCHTCKQLRRENSNSLPVHFVAHQQSFPLPQGSNDRHVARTVELLSIPEPNRREEAAVGGVDSKGVPVLVQDIALQRPNHPDWHSDDTLRILRREAEALGRTDLLVPESTLHPLNRPQQAAVKKALQDTFSVIQGPPGTGKTVTGAYLAYFFTRLNTQIQADKMRPQVLYCGPSNKSVDVVAAYLKKFQNISIVRVYSEQIERKEYPIPGVPGLISKWSRKEVSMSEGLSDIALHRLIRMRGKPHAEQLAADERRFRTDPDGIQLKDIKRYKNTIFEATKKELKNHHIVLCTCSSAGAGRISRFTRIIQVIVDEAGMCSEPETLIPLVSVKPKQVVLVGDHKQLRSIITEPNARQLGIDISLLEKYKDKAEMLTIQYRMHKQICEFPSLAFYDDRLRTAESVMRRGPDPIRSIWPNNGQTPRVFCHVSGQEETLSVKSEEGNEQSKSNSAEIRHVVCTNYVQLYAFPYCQAQIRPGWHVLSRRGLKGINGRQSRSQGRRCEQYLPKKERPRDKRSKGIGDRQKEAPKRSFRPIPRKRAQEEPMLTVLWAQALPSGEGRKVSSPDGSDNPPGNGTLDEGEKGPWVMRKSWTPFKKFLVLTKYQLNVLTGHQT